MESACPISADELYAYAKRRRIPFHKYYMWIDAYMTREYTDLVLNGK
jgi:thiaminase